MRRRRATIAGSGAPIAEPSQPAFKDPGVPDIHVTSVAYTRHPFKPVAPGYEHPVVAAHQKQVLPKSAALTNSRLRGKTRTTQHPPDACQPAELNRKGSLGDPFRAIRSLVSAQASRLSYSL